MKFALDSVEEFCTCYLSMEFALDILSMKFALVLSLNVHLFFVDGICTWFVDEFALVLSMKISLVLVDETCNCFVVEFVLGFVDELATFAMDNLT